MRIGHPGRNRGYNDQLLGSRFLRLDLFQMVNLSITEAVCYRSNQEECWFSLFVVISPLVALMADQVVGSRRPSNSNTKTAGPMVSMSWSMVQGIAVRSLKRPAPEM